MKKNKLNPTFTIHDNRTTFRARLFVALLALDCALITNVAVSLLRCVY